MITRKAALFAASSVLLIAGCATTAAPDKTANVTVKAAPAASAAPGIWMNFIMDTSGPNAGINSTAFIHNENNDARQVRYQRTVHNASGSSSVGTVHVPGRGRTSIGSTCAFDVTYSTLCGSSVSYQLLD